MAKRPEINVFGITLEPETLESQSRVLKTRIIAWNHGRPQGAIRAFDPLEIGTKNQIFLENLKLAAKFRLNHLIFAMTVYLPV